MLLFSIKINLVLVGKIMNKLFVVLSFLSIPVFAFSTKTTQFQSWSLICGDKGNCSLSQLIAKDKAATQVLMGVNINYSVSGRFPVLMLRFPAKINRSSGVGIKIDNNKSIQVPVSQCNDKACQSIIKIDDTLLNEMKNGKVAMIAFALKSKKQLTLPLSFQGFSQAFEALQSKQQQ
jgi:invasion protein IalB